MTRVSKIRVVLLILWFPAVVVADVSGKWTGTVVNERHAGDTHPAVLVLSEKNGRLTGTAGPSEDDQRAIKNGQVEGDRVRFEMTVETQTMSFDLLVAGDRMSGSVTGADASGRSERLTLRARRQ